jgi:hypothetical protein
MLLDIDSKANRSVVKIEWGALFFIEKSENKISNMFLHLVIYFPLAV